MMQSIFSYAYLPSVYFLWWDVCWGIWAIFQLGSLFSYCWVLKVLCIFWITVFRCVYCKYFLPVCGLFSHCFCRVEVFNFNESSLLFLSQIMTMMLYLKKSPPYPMSSSFSPISCVFKLGLSTSIIFFLCRCRHCHSPFPHPEMELWVGRKSNWRGHCYRKIQSNANWQREGRFLVFGN